MASPEDEFISLAHVQRWNMNTVFVLCPYCDKIHRHGFDGKYTNAVRVPHCDLVFSLSFPSYRFAYPFSQQGKTIGYEIDRNAGFFVALGATYPGQDTSGIDIGLDELSLNESRLSGFKRWTDATEMITIGMEDEVLARMQIGFGVEETFTLKKLDHVVSRMLFFGDHEYVENYISTSHETAIFLHGVDKNGESTLSMAACEKHPDVVKLLLDHGADPNHRDKDGRSPLMNAALWGRIDNVRHLLKHGANKDLRDAHGRRAVDLAEPSLENNEERFLHCGREAQVYQENTFIANRFRKVISELLRDIKNSPDRAVTRQSQEYESHSFQKTDHGTIQLVAPIMEYPISTEWKTIASLQRPSEYPKIAAMSGWSHDRSKIIVSGREWTAEVMKISKIVDHELQIDELRDQGTPGQYSASHAEKQLIAYFVDKHVILESDEPCLKLARPPISLEQATILVSRSPCDDCSNFIKAVNLEFRLSISTLDCSSKRAV